MEDDEDPPSLSFHALTASTMLMPWLILSLRKRLYSLGLRFSFFAGFILPSCAILLSMLSCCFLMASLRLRMLSLISLASAAWAFSMAAILVFARKVLFFTSVASRDFTFLSSA